MEPEFTRKLAAIMFTDIVGYSRMMGANETHALRLLNQHDAILAEKIASHSGTVLKKMGDSFFASFDSATSAVNCAIEIQQALRRYNEAESAGNRFSIRIGLHMGDVIVHNDDLFGDGINVAARLQPLAKPGGICISDAVYQAVKKSADLDPVRVGEVELKNILERHVIYEFPPFYESELPDAGSTKPRGGGSSVGAFELERIEQLPSPNTGLARVSTWVAVTAIALLVGMATPFLLGQRSFPGFEALLSRMDSNLSDRPALWFALLPLPIFLLMPAIQAFMSRSIARRYVFRDIRGIDEWLEWIVTELGWREPTTKGKSLLFRPTRSTWLYWGPMRLSIRVDGNGVTAIGPAIFINRLTRTIKASWSSGDHR